jgi:uncharacterized membrane protein
MYIKRLTKNYQFSRSWIVLLFIVVLLGLFFRCAYLGDKIYWVDEVATSLRVAGYSKQEAESELSQLGTIKIADLQKYQQITPEKNFFNSLEVLRKSPEHAPLYFILTRLWAQIWGISPVAIRSLSVIFSLLTLPCFYLLCIELFGTPLVGWGGVSLLSVSPFFVAYAQEARPYSLWMVAILLSSITLLRAIKLNNCKSWFLYVMSLALSFYISLLSLVFTIAQIIYVIVIAKFYPYHRLKNFLIACSISLLIFSPWLVTIGQNLQRMEINTAWMRESMPFQAMIIIWIYGISSIFIESPITNAFNLFLVIRILVDINIFFLLVYSIYFLINQHPRKNRIDILCIFFIYPLIIIIADLIIHGQISTAPRYMIPLYLGLQLTTTYLFMNKSFSLDLVYSKYQHFWKAILLGILLIGAASCSFDLRQSPKYQKSRNLHNIPIAEIINKTEHSLILSEKENTLDLISLSYLLKGDVNFKIQANFANSPDFLSHYQELFLFNPSPKIINEMKQQNQVNMTEVYKPTLFIPSELYLSIWQIKKIGE